MFEGPAPAVFGPGTSSLKSAFLMGHVSGDTTDARLPNAYPIGEGALPLSSWSGMAGRCGGRERSVEREGGLYPGEWQLPTSVVVLPERRFRWRRQQWLWWFRVSLSPRCRGPGPQVGWGLPPPLCLLALPGRGGCEEASREDALGAEGAEPLSGLQVSSPWQRPRPWGRAGGGETSRAFVLPAAWPRPRPGRSGSVGR